MAAGELIKLSKTYELYKKALENSSVLNQIPITERKQYMKSIHNIASITIGMTNNNFFLKWVAYGIFSENIFLCDAA